MNSRERFVMAAGITASNAGHPHSWWRKISNKARWSFLSRLVSERFAFMYLI